MNSAPFSLTALLTVLLFCFSFDAPAQAIKGTLGYVIDGDSFYIIQENGRRVRVRISGIDSPENEQAFGKEATDYLTGLLKDQEITLTPDGADRQGRMVARIEVNKKDVAEEMIRNGYAWHYKKYSSDLTLAKLETEAKANKIGLWKDASPLEPWTYRKQHTPQAQSKQ